MTLLEKEALDLGAALDLSVDEARRVWLALKDIRAQIAAEIEAFADDHSDVSDAYRHAALIARGTPGP